MKTKTRKTTIEDILSSNFIIDSYFFLYHFKNDTGRDVTINSNLKISDIVELVREDIPLEHRAIYIWTLAGILTSSTLNMLIVNLNLGTLYKEDVKRALELIHHQGGFSVLENHYKILITRTEKINNIFKDSF